MLALTKGDQVQVALLLPPGQKTNDVVHASLYGLPSYSGWLKLKVYNIPNGCVKKITASNRYLRDISTAKMDDKKMRSFTKAIGQHAVKGVLGPPPQPEGTDGATTSGTASNSSRTRQR
jgi:hypothetical protein